MKIYIYILACALFVCVAESLAMPAYADTVELVCQGGSADRFVSIDTTANTVVSGVHER
jgi:hypothetical protein